MRNQIIEKLAMLVTAAFGLVAALAWNDAVKAAIAKFVPAADSLSYIVIYAVAITVVAVAVTIAVGKLDNTAKTVPTPKKN